MPRQRREGAGAERGRSGPLDRGSEGGRGASAERGQRREGPVRPMDWGSEGGEGPAQRGGRSNPLGGFYFCISGLFLHYGYSVPRVRKKTPNSTGHKLHQTRLAK